jgi:hypothetical protein
MELEDKTDTLVPKAGQCLMPLTGDQFIVQEQFSGIIGIHGRKNIEQGRFSGTRFAHNGSEFPFFDPKGNILQHMEFHGLLKVFVDVLGF